MFREHERVALTAIATVLPSQARSVTGADLTHARTIETCV